MKNLLLRKIYFPFFAQGIALLMLTSCGSGISMPVTHIPLPPTSIKNTRVVSDSLTPTEFIPLTDSSTTTPISTESPTLTETQSQTSTRTATSTQTETPSSTPNTSYGYIPENAIVIYLTHIGTGGPLACGDNLVAITIGVNRTGNLEKDIQVAVDTLFSIGQHSMSLYNATYPSSLRFSGLHMDKGEAIVELSGSYVKPTNACDASRYRAQVWSTIQQFPEVTRAIPKYRGALLGDLLSIYSDGGK